MAWAWWWELGEWGGGVLFNDYELFSLGRLKLEMGGGDAKCT